MMCVSLCNIHSYWKYLHSLVSQFGHLGHRQSTRGYECAKLMNINTLHYKEFEWQPSMLF